MIVQPSTDLTQFAGKRVIVDHVRRAQIAVIRHGCDCGSASHALHGGVYGSCVEDPHGDCRGGSTAFWWPYGTDLEVAT